MALTPREVELLRLVAKGKTSQEIAAKLRLSEVTVKWHIGNAMHSWALRVAPKRSRSRSAAASYDLPPPIATASRF